MLILCPQPPGGGTEAEDDSDSVFGFQAYDRDLAYERWQNLFHQNSCQTRYSGAYLVSEVLQGRELKEMLPISYLILQAYISLIFEAFLTRVAHICFCVVRINMPLLVYKEGRRALRVLEKLK